MATPIGTNTVTAISRRYIEPRIADQVYKSNALFYRLSRANRKLIQGGTQIEYPLMYQTWNNGGFYSGFDVLDVSPSDTIQNGAWDWRQAYIAVTVDGRTLLRTDSPEAIADFLRAQFAQANMQMAQNLGASLWNYNTGSSEGLDGIVGVVDDGTLVSTYGGIARSGASWWKGVVSNVGNGNATGLWGDTHPLNDLQSVFGSVTIGGRHPTIMVGTQNCYNNLWNNQVNSGYQQTVFLNAGGQDEVLAQAGFTNILFNQVPLVVDNNITATQAVSGATYDSTHTGTLYMLNEDFLYLVVSPRADFKVEDFQTPFNQDAMVSKILWYGNLICNNCQVQAKITTA